uniref:Uncharacterized protein LOC104222440 n=1 Tax=Nicotiana sylvestris TaxID=4096 RepID=A0A1U7VW06_NICSY|nr:PREDICTED: uncharacterized protein LOC104222440 [Nicotiana sylvestris]
MSKIAGLKAALARKEEEEGHRPTSRSSTPERVRTRSCGSSLSSSCQSMVVPSTKYLHTVNDGGRNYTVCLLEKKYICGRFQVDELPCPHAWTVLKSKFLMLEEYCSNYYKPNTIVMTYDVPMYPLPDRNDWNIPEHVAEEVVLPSKWKIPPGRPKKKRDKTLSELLQPKNQHSCSICGKRGYNKRTCRNVPRNK